LLLFPGMRVFPALPRPWPMIFCGLPPLAT
jgi:hypothetical protein